MSGTPHPGSGVGPSGPFVIAIDGPAGTGKSTVARRVAQALTAGYLDTGAMYRIVTLAVLDAGIDPHDERAVAELLPGLTFESPMTSGRQRHRLGDRDVSAEIRGQEVTLAVTPVSANPAVRGYLLDRQRALANSGRMVVEGRDIGTVVVPEACRLPSRPVRSKSCGRSTGGRRPSRGGCCPSCCSSLAVSWRRSA